MASTARVVQETTPGATRRRGRPRSELTRQAALSAAYRLLQSEGLAGLGMQRVASRAGISKTTLYKWWSSPADLALDAFLHAVEPAVDWEDTGCIRADLRRQIAALVTQFTHGGSGRVLSAVIGQAQTRHDVRRALLDRWLLPRRHAATSALLAARDRGQLDGSVDLDVLIDTLYAPLYYRLLIGHLPLHDRLAGQLVDTLAGVLRPCEQCSSTH